MDEQRRLMDELMGAERDVEDHKKEHKKRHFSDPDVCKHYLCGVSPYALFKNTKSDMGDYDKEFDDDCAAEWRRLPQEEKDRYGYEHDLLVLLERLVGQCERRVKSHGSRISEEHTTELAALSETVLSDAEIIRMGELENEIAAAEAQAEDFGVAGRVDDALATCNLCDALKREMQHLESRALNAAREVAGRKHMIVCEVSGNFMNATDNGERLRSHFEGKQYQGWKLIRRKLLELRRQRPPPGNASSGGMPRAPARERERHRDRESDRDPKYGNGGRGYGSSRGEDSYRRDRRENHYDRRRRSRSRSRDRDRRRRR